MEEESLPRLSLTAWYMVSYWTERVVIIESGRVWDERGAYEAGKQKGRPRRQPHVMKASQMRYLAHLAMNELIRSSEDIVIVGRLSK